MPCVRRHEYENGDTGEYCAGGDQNMRQELIDLGGEFSHGVRSSGVGRYVKYGSALWSSTRREEPEPARNSRSSRAGMTAANLGATRPLVRLA